MKTLTVCQILFGAIEVEGVLTPDAKFGVTVVQVANLFQAVQNYAAKDFKRLLGKDSKLSKFTRPDGRSEVTVLTLPQFERVLMLLDRKGIKEVQQFRDSLVGLSLHQLFCDAFGIKFEAEDRQEWLTVRQQTKALFWELSESIKTWMESRECSAPEFTYYSNAYDAINRGLFGMTAKQIKQEANISDLTRDVFGSRSLRRIATVQEASAKLLRAGKVTKPTEAVSTILESLMEQPESYLN